MAGITTERTAALALLLIAGIVATNFAIRGVDVEIDESEPFPGDTLASENTTESPNVTKIVGGTWVKRGVYPYQAAMFLNGSFNCGGTLLDDKHVLTAAHCLDIPGVGPDDMTIYLRTTSLNPLDDDHVKRQVKSIIIHADYNASSFENDIGIITLSEPVKGIRYVRLEDSKSKETYVGQVATVIGFGRTRQVLFPDFSSGPASNRLFQVNVTMIGPEDCKVLYYDEYAFNGEGGRICAVTLHGKGICQGDSGGPLFIDKIQIGITSAAAGCADPRFPAVFTRVARYRDWITKNTE